MESRLDCELSLMSATDKRTRKYQSNHEMLFLVLVRGENRTNPEKSLSEQSRKRTNSYQIWCQGRNQTQVTLVADECWRYYANHAAMNLTREGVATLVLKHGLSCQRLGHNDVMCLISSTARLFLFSFPLFLYFFPAISLTLLLTFSIPLSTAVFFLSFQKYNLQLSSTVIALKICQSNSSQTTAVYLRAVCCTRSIITQIPFSNRKIVWMNLATFCCTSSIFKVSNEAASHWSIKPCHSRKDSHKRHLNVKSFSTSVSSDCSDEVWGLDWPVRLEEDILSKNRSRGIWVKRKKRTSVF